ncbi:hypothetical protein Lalb_Chr03g0043631 [Lupinus albus]|uniref:Uncharacterized protein n=1 Tax=Lupinus albus TaxID=3870 RepID=A0A6A4QWH9_LUPAL|nr:hypothetical protein Lalb_Chr03g0043631 [Lupinus albus]
MCNICIFKYFIFPHRLVRTSFIGTIPFVMSNLFELKALYWCSAPGICSFPFGRTSSALSFPMCLAPFHIQTITLRPVSYILSSLGVGQKCRCDLIQFD